MLIGDRAVGDDIAAADADGFEAGGEAGGLPDLVFAVALFGFHAYHFSPLRADLSNGNTWIFVLPIWLGLGVDAAAQFPSNLFGSFLGSGGRPQEKEVLLGGDASWIETLSWDAPRRWNAEVIDEPYLILTMLCTMLVAFLFTLAFRGRVVGIKACYWISAAVVTSLGARVFLSLSSVLGQ